MARDSISDLLAFMAVARERSFTRAASKLGVSQSSLSHTIRALETRLGVRLLTRTTRSVAPTEAGERLLQTVAPRLQDIESEVAAVSGLGAKSAGTIRITAIDHVVDTLLWPRLRPLIAEYPDLKIEISTDYRMVDIVAEGFDIGVRWGDQVAKDMVAVRLMPDQRMLIVGAPDYLAAHGVPATPQELLAHNCITLRLASSGSLYAWELKNGARELQVNVSGQATFHSVYQMLNAALSGCGLAFVPQDLVQPHLAAGRLQAVLQDWAPVFPGLHAYYPSRRQSTRTLALVIEALRTPQQFNPAHLPGAARR
ncbi:DNA-binding transcriptional LysR family regulator [Variovorax boronicumulans]|uniref:LysR family transcriptional regulator n=1 Tax=Variovorax boronicumulans TaxID=436515 RepID=UPI0027838962|nr:LysR family transcriptional regulator [Variovorax boronicumulans]MDP9993331.1 DNA-binding transcriptional LysR family regulator [Variovorax boronicumulans]MDQ0004802.1 DNA-binding transcriptional LysR family regulator [Variovorax boronicumulans]